MLHATPERPDVSEERPDGRDAFLRAHRWMLLARAMDDRFAALYRAGKIHGGVFLGRGQEALSVALGVALRPGDIYAPLIRDAAGRLAFGETPLDAARTYLGTATGPMRGRDGNIHRGDPRAGRLAMVSHLGAMISVVNGALMARRFRDETGAVGAACLGEGGTSTGAFHEALNQAAVEKLPLVLVLAHNQYAYSTPASRQFACASLTDKAAGYGVAAHEVDGTDLAACLRVLAAVVDAARGGGGPQLVVGTLLRLCGHGEHDDAAYVDARLKASPLGRDCIQVAEQHFIEQGWADGGALRGWRAEAQREAADATAQAQREPQPDPYHEEWTALATPHLREGA